MFSRTKDDLVCIVNGKERKLEHPKWKKLKHVRKVARSETRVAEKIRSGQQGTQQRITKGFGLFEPENQQS